MKNGIVLSTLALCLVVGSVHARDAVIRSNPVPHLQVLWLDTNGCTPQLTEELQEGGYTLAQSRRSADGVLRVSVRQLDANTGASARFSASLRDDRGNAVWETTGREDSISQEELCEDISEDIVERLERRKEAIS